MPSKNANWILSRRPGLNPSTTRRDSRCASRPFSRFIRIWTSRTMSASRYSKFHRRLKIPEINDEFAQRLGDYKTLDELKSKVRGDLEKYKQEHAQEEMREKLLEWLENNNEFEIPESLVEQQLQIRVRRLVRDLSRQGINPQRVDVDWSKIRQDQHQQAIRDVKGSLILDYISEKENITVNDEELDAEIEKIAAETNRPKEKVKEILSRDSGLGSIRGQIRNRQTLDLLQHNARVLSG